MTTLLFISGPEIIIVVLVILLLFGSKKIPDFARTFGKGMNEFRKATEEIKRELNDTKDSFTEEIDEVRDTLNDHVEEVQDTFSETTGESYDPYGVEDQPYPTEEHADIVSDDIAIANENMKDEKPAEKVAESKVGKKSPQKTAGSKKSKTPKNDHQDGEMEEYAAEDLP